MTVPQIDPEFHALIPPLAPEELAQLEANIKADGCRDPLVTWNGVLLDGHNRLAICQRNAIKFQTQEVVQPDRTAACLWIIDNAFGRRNLPIITRVELAEKRKQFIKSRQGQRTDLTSGKKLPEVDKPSEQLAKQAGVSKPTYAAAKLCLDHADDETKAKLRRNEVAVHRVAKDIKEKLGREARKAKRSEAAKGKSLDSGIIIGDFRKQAEKVADGSLALIFTDPPYDKKAEELFPGLADFAATKLADGGSIIFYAGHLQLPAVFDAFKGKLRHWWTCACLHSGDKALMREYGIRVGWKPMLWFVKGTRDDKSEIVFDTVTGDKAKDFHDWEQYQEDAAYYIEHLCPKDGMVCDPFLGGGTTAVAAKALNRKWIGFEINAETARIASGRLSK